MTLVDFAIQAQTHGLLKLPDNLWDLPAEAREQIAASAVESFPRGQHVDFMRTYARLLHEQPEFSPRVESMPGKTFQVPLPPIDKRNLIYHVCPLQANDGWKRNITQLIKRWSVFNGRRVIAINSGDGLDSIDDVHRAFGRLDYDFLAIPNDPTLREVASFARLLEEVESGDDREATFYAHTKGNSTAADMQGAIRWRNSMYRHLLDDNAARPMILLESHAFVGCHKMVWGDGKPPYPSGLNHGDWFLAGTFFWFRHDVVFGDDDRWRNIPNDRYGAEAWPAGIVDSYAAASVYQKFPQTQQYTKFDNPYRQDIYDGEGLDDE